MALSPYKFLIVAVVQRVNEHGKAIGEQAVLAGDKPAEVFGVDGLKEWADDFERVLADLEAQQASE